jgi:EAL domain-containing protein (putative c-di-GMP-specific phosphodiesterase class I)
MTPDLRIEFAKTAFKCGVEKAPLTLLFSPIESLREESPFYRIEPTLQDRYGELSSSILTRYAAEQCGCMGELEQWVINQSVELIRNESRIRKPVRLLCSVGADRSHPLVCDNLRELSERGETVPIVIGIESRWGDAEPVACKKLAVVARNCGVSVCFETREWSASTERLARALEPNFIELPAAEILTAGGHEATRPLTSFRANGVKIIASQLESSVELKRLYEAGIDFVSGPLIGKQSTEMDYDFS